MTVHAKKFSASSSDRWVRCPGSIKACENIEQKISIYAEEGTKAHEIAAELLNNSQVKSKELTDRIKKEDEIYLNQYTSYVEDILYKDTITPHKLFVEQRVQYSSLAPENYNIENDFFGTADAIVCDSNSKTLHIIDLKWGKGVKVDVEENYQLICYALGAINDLEWLYNIQEVELHIVQPRANNINSIKLNRLELEFYEIKLKEAAEKALDKDAERIPHEKACRFCPAKTNCPALLKLTNEAVISKFEKTELNDEDRKLLLDNSKLIIDFLSSIETDIHNKLLGGGSFKGYKLVSGRSSRKWNEDAEKTLKEVLGESAYEKSLIGVIKADKLIPKDIMSEITYKEDGRPLLVKEDDKRQEYNIVNMFNILN